MTLRLPEALREARSLPYFDGESEYSITHFLRDIWTVLTLTADEDKVIIIKVLFNKLKGKALHIVEQMHEPDFPAVLDKLKEEFGVKTTFLNLRNEAMNIKPHNIDDLHSKLRNFLNIMNNKYHLEGCIDLLYTPINNTKLIYDIYLSFIPFNVKTLLLQNNISNLESAYTYYVQNNMLCEIKLKNHGFPNAPYNRNSYGSNQGFNNYNQSAYNNNNQNNYRSNNPFRSGQNVANFNQRSGNFNRNFENNGSSGNFRRFSNRNYENNNSGNFQRNYENNNFGTNYENNNNSGNFSRNNRTNDHANNYNTRSHNSGNFNNGSENARQYPVVPMDVDNVQHLENFQLSPLQPTYP